MPHPERIGDIVADAREARQQLAAVEHQLQHEIDEIDFGAFREGRPLSDEEIGKRREFRASQAEVRDALIVLAFVTARRLDESAEVAMLQRQIGRINSNLRDDLDRLRGLEAFSERVAKITDLLARIVSGLAGLM